MENLGTEIVVWMSPIAGAIIAWFISDLISDIKGSIKDIDITIKVISKELTETQKSVVKIETNVDNLMDTDYKSRRHTDEFEAKVVSILRNAKGKFE